MDFLELAKERYSCKKFSSREVKEDVLNQILEAGRVAPTAKNAQEQRVYVAKSEDALKKIDAATRCRYGAPIVLVVAYEKSGEFVYPGGKVSSGVEDATIVATHMVLMAKSVGVDSCIINLFDPAELKASLSLPMSEEIIMLLDIGYADESSSPLPNHSSRKAIVETVKYI